MAKSSPRSIADTRRVNKYLDAFRKRAIALLASGQSLKAPAQKLTWKHPKLGKFNFDDGWTATLKVPGFKLFQYITPYSGKPDGEVKLEFYVDQPTITPSPSAVALATRLLAHPKKLATLITQQLWKDITGNGVNSRMWWHNDLEEVRDVMEADASVFKKAADLLKVLRLYRIVITDDGQTMANLSFHAYFEPEHAVGVLTDGQRVFGIGYSGDVRPFKSFKSK